MPVIDGQKFACESCVKGHRVSNCNHYERDLKPIAPKGRPVKQCDHCRTARKSKSQHGKCDCGSKKEKKEGKSDLKKEDAGCCCHKGEKCFCGNKNEGLGARLEKALSRPTHSVKSKPPRLTTSLSEPKLAVTNGHHAPIHRNNNLAHTSGAPYKIPRPHTLHGVTAFVQTAYSNDETKYVPRASDDMFGLDSKLYASTSQEDLQDAISNEYGLGFTSYGSLGDQAASTQPDFGWTLLSTVAEDQYASLTTSPLVTSPNFMGDSEWTNIPSATTESFTTSDLPLRSPQVSTFTQAISHSDESNYAPAMTSGSSRAQSETDLEAFWNENVQRDNQSRSWDGLADNLKYNNVFDPSGLDVEPPQSISSATSQSRHLSDSSATTAFHMGSLGTEPEDNNDYAIVIPNGEETQEWDWQGDSTNNNSADLAKDYGWLLDS